ncbi:STAS domain-containing protein [Streptomyces sp. NPDC058655]|uniref:STAS domain-containing protein n=1 Tax=unclassified Streptomyces TaxID=2593676 RepID=UPI0036587F41
MGEELNGTAASEAGAGPLGYQHASGAAWVVEARGELDLDTLPPLEATLSQAAASHHIVILDAAGVTFADSTCLNVLLRVRRLTDLRIARPSHQLARLLALTGADQVVTVYPDLATATLQT